MAAVEFAQLCTILESLTSNDNTLRQDAEGAFYSYRETHLEDLLLGLIRIMKEHPDVNLRTQAVTSLRSIFRLYSIGKDETTWNRVSPNTRTLLKLQLLDSLENDVDATVQNSTCITISVLGGRLAATGAWPELNPKLISMIENGSFGSQERALKILAELVPYISSVIEKNVAGLHGMISMCAKSQSSSVRYQALCFVSALVLSEPRKIWKTFQDTLPDFLTGLALLNDSTNEYPEDYLSAFVVIADVDATFFKPHFSIFFDRIIYYTTQQQDETRQMAVEVLLSVAENKPSMCLKLPNFVTRVINALLELMLTVKSDGNWIDDDEDNSDSLAEETRNYDVGESGLDRLTAALGGEHVMNVLFHYVSEYLRKEEWQYKLVAIMAISQTAEYLPEQDIDNHLEEITRMLLAQLKHSHHYVRFAACQALGQIASDHQPHFQNTYASEVFPALISTIDDVSTKVQTHAISALINLAEEADKSDLLPYADALMQMLYERISPSKPLKLREQGLTCIAVVAGVLEKGFLKYYNIVMPATKKILENAVQKSEYVLRGRAVECATIIGISVGNEVFEADAHDVMKSLLQLDAENSHEDETADEYVNDAFRRMCRLMKESFYPYVQHLMVRVLKSLSLPETTPDDPQNSTNDMTLSSITRGEGSSLKTSVVQDMIHSLDLLFTMLETLGVLFKDYVLPTVQTLLPLVKLHFNDSLKRSLLDCLAELLKVSKELEVSPSVLSGWTTEIVEKVFDSLSLKNDGKDKEPDLDLLVVEASGVAKCLRNAGPNLLTDVQVNFICTKTFVFMRESNQRRALLASQKQDPEYDEEDLLRLEEEACSEQTFRSSLLEIIAAVMKNHPESFLRYGAPLCQEFITTYIHPNCSNDDRALALYICDDILEHLRNHGAPMWPSFVEQLVASVLDKEPSVRQASAYGLIQASHCSQFPVELIQRAVANLVLVLNEPASKEHNWLSARDNVIAALGSLVLHCGIHLGPKPEDYLQLWIDNLPLKVDDEEGRRTHKDLMDLILKGNNQVLGQNNSNLPKLTAFCATIYKTEFSNTEIDTGIRQFMETVGFENVGRLGASFSKKLQQGLERIHKDVLLEKNPAF